MLFLGTELRDGATEASTILQNRSSHAGITIVVLML